MLYLIKLAVRNLYRNPRRTFLTALAISISLALLFLVETIGEGEGAGALDATIRLQTGHIQVRTKSYEEEKRSLKWEDLLRDPEILIQQIETLPQVVAAAPQLWGNAILSIRDETVNIQIVGIEPDNVVQSAIRESMVAGQFITKDDRNGIIIGQKLARDLNLKVADTVELSVSTSEGTPDIATFTIRGIFDTGASNYDEVTVFMPLSKAQAIVKAEGHASAIVVMLKDREQADQVIALLQSSNFKIMHWRELNKITLQAVELSDAFMFFINIIILAMGVTIVMNTLVMSVFERTREIGILTSIGMKGRQIIQMLLVEAGMIGLVGLILGNILGLLFSWYFVTKGLYVGDVGVSEGMIYTDTIYARFNILDLINLSILSLIVTLLGSLYPALLAASLEPVRALHSDQ